MNGEDLKGRIQQILGRRKRDARVPVRTAVTTMLLGGLMVMPFAALHMHEHPIQVTHNGFIDLGNGKWVRIVAVTKIGGGHAVSWNMNGALLPRAIGASNLSSNDAKQVLVIGTNLDEPLRVGFSNDGVHPEASLSGPQMIPAQPGYLAAIQSIAHETLICYPLAVPEKGNASAYFTVPAAGSICVKDLPTQPSSDQVMGTWNPPGVDIQLAKNDHFKFDNGQILKLLSVSATFANRAFSWTPEGCQTVLDSLSQSVTQRTDHDPDSDPIRAVAFSIPNSASLSGKPTRGIEFRCVYDAADFLTGYEARTETIGSQTKLEVPIHRPANAPPQDLVVQMIDFNRRRSVKYPLAAVTNHRQVGTATDPMTVNGTQLTQCLSVAWNPEVLALEADPAHETILTFLDAHGETVGSSASATLVGRDEQFYFVSKAQAASITQVEVTSIPYIYIRFPHIAMNPTAVTY